MPNEAPRITAFLGYAPDVDPTLDGVMTNCVGIVPTQRGFAGAPSPISTVLSALPAACHGVAAVMKTDDTTRLFAGTLTQLLEASGATWTTRSGTISGLGAANRWRFAQFQDSTLAAAITEKTQFIAGATQFADVTATAPKCAIIEAVNNFVIGFDVIDQAGIYEATATAHPDGWWCAAKGGYTSWIPNVDTEAATGTLSSTPGKILGAKAFGYQCIAYKKNSMYLGTYVGSGVIWDWQLIPGSAGALSNEVIINVGTPGAPQHIFMGPDNFYRYRAGQVEPIGEEVNDAVFDNLNTEYYYAATALHDFKNKLVYFYYPVVGAITPDSCVVFNYLTGKWGRDDRTVEATAQWVAPGITYAELGTNYTTYADFPDAAYNLAFLTSGVSVPMIVNTSHVLQTLTSTPGTTSITSNDIGDETVQVLISRVVPRFITKPATCTLTNYYREQLGDALTTDQTTTIDAGRFDFTRSAPWHRVKFTFTGAVEITGFRLDAKPDGEIV